MFYIVVCIMIVLLFEKQLLHLKIENTKQNIYKWQSVLNKATNTYYYCVSEINNKLKKAKV